MTVFYGIDPGRTIGVGRYDPINKLYAAFQEKEPGEVMYWIKESISPQDVVVLEKFVGGGYLTKDGIYTIELVGWFKYQLEWEGYKVITATSQQRLSGLSEAKKLMQAQGVEGPHSWDALSHAIVHARVQT